MNVRFFGCGKFGWLASESEDRELTPRETVFMERHRRVCAQCAKQEEATALALNMLRESSLESEDLNQAFDRRLLRRVRLQSLQLGLQNWSPALLGGVIAAVALVSALQILSRTDRLPIFRTGNADARRIELSFPEFPHIPIAERIPETR